MNFTSTVTVTARGTGAINQTTGIADISPVTVLEDLQCSFTILNAAEQVQHWGSEQVDTARTYANVRLPDYVPALPQSGRKLTDYDFDLGQFGKWQPEAVRNGKSFQAVLVSQKY